MRIRIVTEGASGLRGASGGRPLHHFVVPLPLGGGLAVQPFASFRNRSARAGSSLKAPVKRVVMVETWR